MAAQCGQYARGVYIIYIRVIRVYLQHSCQDVGRYNNIKSVNRVIVENRLQHPNLSVLHSRFGQRAFVRDRESICIKSDPTHYHGYNMIIPIYNLYDTTINTRCVFRV